MSSPGIVFDACVLVPMPLADTLLRLAAQKMYRPVWNETILNELARTLVKLRYTEGQAQRRIYFMKQHFPESTIVEDQSYRDTFGLPDPDDEHVLATAVQSGSGAIVTLNLRDFPSSICSTHGIEVLHPDAFLVRQFRNAPNLVCHTIVEQAQATTRPVLALSDLLGMLHEAAPEFAGLVDAHIDSMR